MSVIATASLTLPEGATISVSIITHLKAKRTEIQADCNGKVLKLRGDTIAAHNLQEYLRLIVVGIQSKRRLIVVKPTHEYIKPTDLRQFVNDMAYHGMFLFEALTDERNGESKQQRKRSADTGRSKRVPKPGKKISKQHGVKSDNAPTGSTSSPARGTCEPSTGDG